MAFISERIKFEEQFEYLDKTKQWLKNIGINTSNTRFENIYNLINKIVEYSSKNILNELIEQHDKLELSLALVDAISFIKIYKAFKNEKNHIYPRQKLKKILEGPYYSWEEDPMKGDNENRNILFELETAAFFKKAGVEIIGFDDNDFYFEGKIFNVQCKRIFSEKKFQDNLDEAVVQFNRKWGAQPDLKGIICISIDKLIGLEEFVIKIKNMDQIKGTFHKDVISFGKKYRNKFNKIVNINMLAVFLFFHGCAILEEEPHDLLINCVEIEGNIIPSRDLTQFSDYYLIEKLAEKINAVNTIIK